MTSWAELERIAPELAAAVQGRFAAHKHASELDQELPPSGVGLFRTDLIDASLTRVEGDWLVVDSWREGESPTQRRRR